MPAITGPDSIVIGTPASLTTTATAGSWSSSTSTIASVTSVGIFSGLSPGIDTITYTNMCGTSTYTVTVSAAATTNIKDLNADISLSLSPNPNNGQFYLSGALQNSDPANQAKIDIKDILCREIYSDVISLNNGIISKQIHLSETVANGIYILKIYTDNSSKTFRLILNR